ncbi:hypothetical protein MUN76_12835 [Leucobacter rhizosphaerae]|uniref:LGFP repeat-containing protein n=1 Tax=Leucobacter rhizosphaerae TaxID=2932245 RepID=A0ABY4FUI1_9MICO|nr:hypothetical protein [Leucobacter rhizosphaerae]UOQ59918.1 hypothetical protein MUN76_12835 [Leucobacter rhizosphaerae]
MARNGAGIGRRLLAVLAASAIALTGLQVVAAPAQAVNATDFNPSNIISDAEFYNGSSMTTAEVQSFLNQRLPRCTIGDPGRLPWSPYGSTFIASVCLKDSAFTTTTRPANAYCHAYVGATNESAAAIINKVSRACNINPKVLMVMLEKEQSLITDSWPTVRQYDRAMGYACPDSGPNNSANCDPSQTGFPQQVYRAAWQLQVYKAFPNSYNYKPFQVNTIQWNPDIGCGTSQVYIENWATAALYIYTPYRPNQAALNAGWGTGDSCSSYGNRNFFLLYNTWFTTSTIPGQAQIDAKYAQNGWLGAATSSYTVHTANGGGTVRAYTNGAVTWRTGASAAYVLTGDFRTFFGTQGGLAGTLGWPTSDAAAKGPGRTQAFQGGAVSHTAQHGFLTVSGEIRSTFASAGLGYDGPLGWPTANRSCSSSSNCVQPFEQGTIKLTGSSAVVSIPAIDTVASAERSSLGAVSRGAQGQRVHGGGFVQAHANGAIAWSKTTGAFSISGAVREALGANGGIAGYLGWPVSAVSCATSGVCTQNFQGGSISVDASGHATVMSTAVATAYASLLNAGVDLGRSLGNTRTVTGGAGGTVHNFEQGAIAVSDRTGAFAVMAPIRTPYNAAGGLTGALGWPTGNARLEAANGGGTVQGFENGAVTSTSTGSFVLTGAMRTKFGALGGLVGSLGWPTSNAVSHTVQGGGTVQAFQNGALTHRSGAANPVLLNGEIRRVFGESGGLAGTPGWPSADAKSEPANGGGSVQGFQGAAIASSPHGTFLVSGPMRAFFNAQGGLTGTVGWPTSAMTCTGDECRQDFQGATLTWNSVTKQGSVIPLGSGLVDSTEATPETTEATPESSEPSTPPAAESGDDPTGGSDDAVAESEGE